MESARRMLQVMRLAFVVGIALYAVIVKVLPTAATPKVVVGWALTLIAVVDVAIIFAFRRMMIKPAEIALATQTENPAALVRWRNGYVITYALCEAIALYGLMLHFLGFRFAQVAPFFIAGFVLILFYAPRIPAEAS